MKLFNKKSIAIFLAFVMILTMTSGIFAQGIEEMEVIEESIEEEKPTEAVNIMEIRGLNTQEFVSISGILTANGQSINGHLTAKYAWISSQGELLVAFSVTGPAYQKNLINLSYNGMELFTSNEGPQEGVDYFKVSTLVINGTTLGEPSTDWLVVNLGIQNLTEPMRVGLDYSENGFDAWGSSAIIIDFQEYTVTYESNGGSGTINDLNNPYIYGEEVTVLSGEGYMREHHTFAGWNTSADGTGTAYQPGDKFNIFSDIVLYAQWIPDNMYQVLYNANGGTGAVIDPNSPYYEGEEVTILSGDGFTRENHTFGGWNTSADGSGTAYQPGEKFNMPASNVLLYAQWEKNIVPPLEITGYNGIYDGENHSITVDGLVDGDKVYYSEDGENWQEENPSYANVGEYNVYVKVTNPNYENRTGTGTLEITKRDITIKANSASKVYDGTPLTASGYEIVSGSFVGEEGFESVTVEGSQTLVGTSDNTITGYTFKDNTKATNYNVITQKGTLTVEKATVEIEITANSANKVYDGTPLTASGYEMTGDLLTGDKIEVTVSGTITDVGTATNEITEVKITHDGTDVTENYNITKVSGTLEITAKEVTITVDNKTKVYGTADPTFTGTVEGLINENDLGEITYVRTNTEENVGTYAGVLDANYTNNPNYQVTVIKGNFEITKAQGEGLEITDYTGIYDGENHSIEVEGFVDGDTVSYSEDGENWQEENPSYANVGEHKVYVKVENPNYADREGFGTVEITPRDISIQSQSATKVYDGTPLTKNEFTIIKGELVGGEKITVIITGSQTNVGSSKNTIQSISIKSGDTDVTGNYNITKVEGTLTVTQPYYPPYIPPEEEIDEEVPTDLPELTDEHIAYIQGYPDNTVRPLAFITREEVATVFYRLLDPEYRSMVFSTQQNFLDVKATRWSNKHIATLANAGVILGYEDGTFKPEKYITRAELAVIASRFDNLSPFESDKFSDIKGHWANKYINSAAEKGWVNGYEDGTFKPDNYISRAEFVTLVNQVLNRRVSKENILEDARQFPDLIEGKWYYEAMQEAINSHEFEWLEDDTEKWTKIYYPDLDM